MESGPAGPWVAAAIGAGWVGLGALLGARHFREEVPPWKMTRSGEKTEVRLWIRERLADGQFDRRYRTIPLDGEDRPARKGVEVTIPLKSAFEPRVDEVWATTGLPDGFPRVRNPNGFDYGAYRRRQGVPFRLRIPSDAETPDSLIFRPIGFKGSLAGKTARLRGRLEHSMRTRGLRSETQALVSTLVLGDRNKLEPGLRDRFTRAGAAHLLVLSGLHAGLLTALVMGFLRPLRLWPWGRAAVRIAGLAALWGLTVLTGSADPVLRTAIMGSLYALAMALGRPVEGLQVVGISALLMLSLNPGRIYDIGFQLGFAAVIGLIWAYPVVDRKIRRLPQVFRPLCRLTAVGLVAQSATLPLVLYHFHAFPASFLLTDLLLLPVMPLLLGLSALSVLDAANAWYLPGLVPALEAAMAYFRWAVEGPSVHGALYRDGIPFPAYGVPLAYLLFIVGFLELGRNKNQPRLRIGTLPLPRPWTFVLPLCLVGYGYAAFESTQGEELWLGHRYGHSLLVHRDGRRVTAFTPDSVADRRAVSDYSIGVGATQTRFQDLGSALLYRGDRIFFYHRDQPLPPKGSVDYLILTGSPRSHMGKVLDTLGPRWVIADGNNKGYLVRQWAASCAVRGIPFHNTYDKGAYFFPDRKKSP